MDWICPSVQESIRVVLSLQICAPLEGLGHFESCFLEFGQEQIILSVLGSKKWTEVKQKCGRECFGTTIV